MADHAPAARGRFDLDPDRQRALIFVGVMALIMWVAEIIDTVLGGDLDAYGIEPRDTDGLDGVALSPFLHGGFDHLIANTLPFLVLGGMIALSGLRKIVSVTVIVAVIGGLGTWLIAPANTIHIGASGIVFGYASYLIARAIYTRSFPHLGAGIVVVAIWGVTLLSGLVPQEGISWQGHLFGAVGGVVAAWWLDGRTAGRRRAAADAVA
ncbi:rhomboid family intramembrane serine protease [Svornostia abyssi]|uniref:Rhomboid family intramembrane serine protease n=1 Tax=Svornostia abyssi TaxID=2898438 RepID=A0ABY5PNE9_9ACTN|nr:rhomboid family intramembrane serine protease [Parviterribacteraceae bacterium J379]